jgi:hypothetical protein
MDKLDKIRAWAKDLDEPILCFVNGSDAEVIKLAKAVLEEKIAEIILLGDELEVYDQCKVYRLPGIWNKWWTTTCRNPAKTIAKKPLVGSRTR